MLVLSRLFAVWLKAMLVGFPYTDVQLFHSFSCISRQSNIEKQRPVIQYKPPPLDQLKWNTYGSSLGKPGPAGTGGVLRDSEDRIRCQFSCSAGVIDSNVAEVRAILFALEISKTKDGSDLWHLLMETDSLLAVRWINSNGARPWRPSSLLAKIDILSEGFPTCKVVHSPR